MNVTSLSFEALPIFSIYGDTLIAITEQVIYDIIDSNVGEV